MAQLWTSEELPPDSQGKIDTVVEEIPIEIDKEYFNATLYFISGIRIPINWVEESVLNTLRNSISRDVVIDGKDFSVNMKDVCFVEVLEIACDD